MTLKEAAGILYPDRDAKDAAANLRQAIARGSLRAEKIGRDWHVTREEVLNYRVRTRGKA